MLMQGEQATVAILTIVSNNYLHFARTMLMSAKAQHADARLYCVVVDSDLSHGLSLQSEFELIPLEALNLPLGEAFLFQYSIVELNTAVKPWAIEYLLARGHSIVIYVDPDIFFYAPMEEAQVKLTGVADILLTPHLLAPVADHNVPGELEIRRSGIYNLGFIGVRKSVNTSSFLSWWQQKLTRDCVIDFESGIFVDQGWIDLVPGLFEKVGILRDPGYNVAYWNLAQRSISQDAAGKYLVGDTRLVFFHFSGLNPFNPEPFSKYQNRFALSQLGPAARLVEQYVAELLRNGASRYSQLTYGFDHFASGELIPDEVRSLYRSDADFRAAIGSEPFNNPSAVNELSARFMVDGHAPTYLMIAYWIARRDLQTAFDLSSVESIQGFYEAFVRDPFITERLSQSLLAHHKQIIAQSNRRGMPVKRGVMRVSRLYALVLNRTADAAGLRSYSEMCNSMLGYTRAWIHICASAESRAKPRLLARTIKALVRAA